MVDYRENNNWTVYVHIVPKELSGYDHDKYYVGVTSRDVKERWHGGSNYNGQVFYNAIKKYGWGNIEHEIVAENLTKDEAYEFEKTMIKALNSANKNYGYNVSEGGEGGNKKEVKPVKQYDKNGVFIEIYQSAAEAARSIGCDRTNITHACKTHGLAHGYMWRYENDEEPQPYRRKTQKTVIQTELDGTFVNKYWSLKEASDKTCIGKDNIYRCIKGKNKYAGGYLWLYEEE